MIFNLRYESESRVVSFYDGKYPISDLKGISENVITLKTSQGALQDGVSVSGRSVEARQITITGDITNPDTDRASLLAGIVPKTTGRLILEQNGAAPVYLEVECSRTPIIQNIRGVQMYQVVFTAPFPFWRTVEQVNNTLWGYSDIPVLFSVSGDGSGLFENFDDLVPFNLSTINPIDYVTVWNLGNLPLPVIFDISARGGSATNFTVFRVGSSPLSQMRFIGTLVDGERVVIDTNYGNKGATKINTDSTEENAFGNIDESSDWGFSLPVGASQIGFNADSGSANLEVVFQHPAGIFSGV
ncbi:hypothetical protein CCP3SC1AL1_110039 [Gammaproteobacteria bacterium]